MNTDQFTRKPYDGTLHHAHATHTDNAPQSPPTDLERGAHCLWRSSGHQLKDEVAQREVVQQSLALLRHNVLSRQEQQVPAAEARHRVCTYIAGVP